MLSDQTFSRGAQLQPYHSVGSWSAGMEDFLTFFLMVVQISKIYHNPINSKLSDEKTAEYQPC